MSRSDSKDFELTFSSIFMVWCKIYSIVSCIMLGMWVAVDGVAELGETDSRGVNRIAHHLAQTALVVGQALPHRQVKYLFRQVHHALDPGASPG